jgi:hypothetical protein
MNYFSNLHAKNKINILNEFFFIFFLSNSTTQMIKEFLGFWRHSFNLREDESFDTS